MSDYMVEESTGRQAVRYKSIVVWIHWITALFVVAQVVIGLKFADMPKGPVRTDLFAWHKTVGAIILLLALVRLAVRLMNPPPPFPQDIPKWERTAAVWSHRLFYFLLVALPLTGLAAVSKRAVGGMTDLQFGLRFPVVPIPALGEAHVFLVWSLIVLLVIHVGAALKQQFFDRGEVADRMPPFRSLRHDRAEDAS